VTASPVLVSPTWLALREEAHAQARSLDLVEEVQRWLPPGGSAVIQDLGSGTGSMGRWLAPLLTGPQHWVTAEAADGRLSVTCTTGPAGPATMSAAALTPGRPGEPLPPLSTYVTAERNRAATSAVRSTGRPGACEYRVDRT
jgi:hypothetical protein